MDKKYTIRQGKQGLFASCKLLSEEDAPSYKYAQTYYRVPEAPGISAKLILLLEKMARLRNDEIPSEKFLRKIMGWGRNACLRALKEGQEAMVIIKYPLIGGDNKRISYGYRLVTMLVPLKDYQKNDDGSGVKTYGKAYALADNIHAKPTQFGTGTGAGTEKKMGEFGAGSGTGTDAKSAQFGTGTSTGTNTVFKLTDNLVCKFKFKPTLLFNVLPYPLKEGRRKAGALLLTPPLRSSSENEKGTDENKNEKTSRTRRTKEEAMLLCHQELNVITTRMLNLSSDKILSPGVARSLVYRVLDIKTITEDLITQMEYLIGTGVVKPVKMDRLVRQFNRLLELDTSVSEIREYLDSIMNRYIHIFPNQQKHHRIPAKLRGLQNCRNMVRSGFLTHSRFKAFLTPGGYRYHSPPATLIQANREAGKHNLLRSVPYDKSVVFSGLDLGSMMWLQEECARDPESFVQDFKEDILYGELPLWEHEELKAEKDFAVVGLNFSTVKAAVLSLGSEFLDPNNAGDFLLTHLNHRNKNVRRRGRV